MLAGAEPEDTSTVTVELLDVTPLAGRGRIVAVAQVELVLDGVAIVLQGVRVVRRADGLVTVEPPMVRHTDGDLVPAVVLPEELEDAVARAVVEGLSGRRTVDRAADALVLERSRYGPIEN